MSETKLDVFQTMVAGKIGDIRSAINEIDEEIKQRKDIDSEVLEEIQGDILAVRNRMLEVEQFSGSIHGEHPFPKIDVLERELVELQGQKRNETVSCWRDLTALRREIRAYMKELNDLMRKAELVKNEGSRGIAKEA